MRDWVLLLDTVLILICCRDSLPRQGVVKNPTEIRKLNCLFRFEQQIEPLAGYNILWLNFDDLSYIPCIVQA